MMRLEPGGTGISDPFFPETVIFGVVRRLISDDWQGRQTRELQSYAIIANEKWNHSQRTEVTGEQTTMAARTVVWIRYVETLQALTSSRRQDWTSAHTGQASPWTPAGGDLPWLQHRSQ
jgi:hypothetical protein